MGHRKNADISLRTLEGERSNETSLHFRHYYP